MKILMTGDLHSRKGIYTDIVIDFFDYIIETVEADRQIEYVIFDGDLFDKSSRIYNELFIAIFFKLRELKELGVKIILILGNHDVFNMNNDSLIETFLEFGTIVKDHQSINIDGIDFELLAYTKASQDIPKTGDYLITHLSIASFTFDNNYHVNEKNNFLPEEFAHFKRVFSGHFHKFQEKDNITYIGAPFQQNFGERDNDKFFIIFDTKTEEYEKIQYDEAPTYHRYLIMDVIEKIKEEERFDNQFVEIIIEEKIDNFVKLKHKLIKLGAIDVLPFFKKKTGDSINVDISIGSDLHATLIDYVENFPEMPSNISKTNIVRVLDKIKGELGG